jgi:mycoredoxin
VIILTVYTDVVDGDGIIRHDRRGIPYRYVDLEADPEAAAQVRWLTGGYLSHPTVIVAGVVLVEPTIRELDAARACSWC